MAMVRHLIGQLADAPDELEFRARFERVSAEAGHRLFVAEMESEVVGVLHVFERPALEKPCEAVVLRRSSSMASGDAPASARL